MKNIFLLIFLSTAVFSCKNSEEKNTVEEITTENVDNLQTFNGDFIDSDGALVLMGSNFIYGVKRNEVSDELSQKTSKVKKNDFDMVGVTVKGTISENTETDSEWDEVITIKEILKVNETPSEVDIKLEESAKTN